jgi:hypothetical protein
MYAQIALALAIVVGLTGLGGGVYLQGRKDGKAACTAADQREREIGRLAYEAAQRGAAEAVINVEVKNTTIRQELQREVQIREVFRDCRSGPDAVRLLNRTPGIAASGPQPAGDSQLPAADAPR